MLSKVRLCSVITSLIVITFKASINVLTSRHVQAHAFWLSLSKSIARHDERDIVSCKLFSNLLEYTFIYFI